jgi:hypothetical protein
MLGFSKLPVSEAMSEPELKHRVSVTVSDPQHTMASKRKDKVEKRVRITANDKHAEELAKHHFKKQGYKVHDVNYIGVTEATVMQVNELTSKAIASYAYKAGKEVEALKKHVSKGGEYIDIAKKVLAKREKGHNKAVNKLATRAMMKDYHDSSKAGRLTDEVNMEEAVTVKKQNYSWGKMVTVHDGSKTSYPLHPEHQKELSRLRDGDKTSFKDETGRHVHAHREGDKVHLMSKGGGYKPTTVPFHHFDEQAETPPFEGGVKNKGTVKDKSGAMHSAMSRAKHLAKMAASKEKVVVKGFKKFNDK